MREIKFRAWDDENKKMYSPEELEQEGASELEKTIYGYLSFGAVLIYDFKNPEEPVELLPHHLRKFLFVRCHTIQ